MVNGAFDHEIQKDIVFLVEGTSINGAYINELKSNYVLPTLEYFNQGPIEPQEYGCDSTNVLYGFITYQAVDCRPKPSCSTLGYYTDPQKIIHALERLASTGGRSECHANIAEGLATTLQYFEDLRKVREAAQRYCILICNSPGYKLPVMECAGYNGQTVEILADTFCQRNILLSIFSPRKVPALLTLFEKAGGDLSLSRSKNYTKDPRHLILLNGYSLKERPVSPTSNPTPYNSISSITPAAASTAASPNANSMPFRQQPQRMPMQMSMGMPMSMSMPASNQQQGQASSCMQQVQQQLPIAGQHTLMPPQQQQPPQQVSQTQMQQQLHMQQQQMQQQQYKHQQQQQQHQQQFPQMLNVPRGPSGMMHGNYPQQNNNISNNLRNPVQQARWSMMPPQPQTQSQQQIQTPQQLQQRPYMPVSNAAIPNQQNSALIAQLNQPPVPQPMYSQRMEPPQTVPLVNGTMMCPPQQFPQQSYSPVHPLQPHHHSSHQQMQHQQLQQQQQQMQQHSQMQPLPQIQHQLQQMNCMQKTERPPIWQGVLEWIEKTKIPSDPQKCTRQTPCHVTVIPKEGDPALKAGSWPTKLIMQLMPKPLISVIGGPNLKNSTSVLFHLTPCEALDALTKAMSNGFGGCVHFNSNQNSNCDIKVLILLYTQDKAAFLGFIPNDQQAFVDRLHKLIQQQRTSATTVF